MQTRKYVFILTDDQFLKLTEEGYNGEPLYGEVAKERGRMYRAKEKAEKEWMREELKKAGIIK